MTHDMTGGVIITWHDMRNLNDMNIYAQRISASGATLWTSNSVIVSKVDIPANTDLNNLIAEGQFVEKEIPTDALVEGAVTSVSQLRNRRNNAFILAGEQIPISRVEGAKVPGGVLSIPEGHQAVTVSLGAPRAVGAALAGGDNVTIYQCVTLGGTSWNPGKRHPTLGHGVVVGAGAKILGPITVGDGARVAANSVVIEAVPQGATVVGIPGKVVKVKEAGRLNPYGIDLDHHLIPDPVGKAIACLLSRIDALEDRLAHRMQNFVCSLHKVSIATDHQGQRAVVRSLLGTGHG